MIYIDKTQKILADYLSETQNIMDELLAKEQFNGGSTIIANLDLGFPHDVIRLGGGFATGIYIEWESKVPFVPVDICMNACSVSLYELGNIEGNIMTDSTIRELLTKLEGSSYKANFHRGNHFISYLVNVKNKNKFLVIHSSASEFETGYNGLYPVEGNFVHTNVKTYYSQGRYLRYLVGGAAEMYLKIAANLYVYNENRHDFIVSALVENKARIFNSSHYHHYGMPSNHEAVIGCHLSKSGDTSPLLTRPGENIYLLKYSKLLQNDMALGDRFTTPHGLGKRHLNIPNIQVDCMNNKLILDELDYKLQYGESLRAHLGLLLRDINIADYMNYLGKVYDYSIIQEFRQLASYNKSGFINWIDGGGEL